MNKILVLYDSASGNTAKMADLVAEGACEVPDVEVRVRHLDEATAARLNGACGSSVPLHGDIASGGDAPRFTGQRDIRHRSRGDSQVPATR